MNTLTAVVIEADPELSSQISSALQDGGFRVRTVGTGQDGIDAVSDDPPSLVTTDLQLPGIDGQEVVRRIRQFSNVPILILSTSNELGDLICGLGRGADGYLVKPVKPKVLLAHVQALLRRPA